jgi:hypothetical protein
LYDRTISSSVHNRLFATLFRLLSEAFFCANALLFLALKADRRLMQTGILEHRAFMTAAILNWSRSDIAGALNFS